MRKPSHCSISPMIFWDGVTSTKWYIDHLLNGTLIKNLLTPCLFKCKHVLPRHWCWNFCRWLGIAFSWWCLIYIVFDDMMWALPTKPCQKPAFQFDIPRIGSKETWKSLSRTVWCWSLDAWRPHHPSVARWVISWSSFAKMVSPFGEGEKIQFFLVQLICCYM